MSRITPFLWFEKDIDAIGAYYKELFGATLKRAGGLDDTPSGHVDMGTLTIYGQEFQIMTAGPYLPFTPSVSFIVSCASVDEVKELWNRILPTGKVLMDLAAYPFAEQYGWITDQYGVSWQIMHMSGVPAPQKVTPTLMFAGARSGKGEEAMHLYADIFKPSAIDYTMHYEAGENTQTSGTLKHGGVTLDGYHMSLMDSGVKNDLDFNQAISFVVTCKDQAEIDYYWDALTKDGGNEVQCGWLNDKYGMPWQIVPEAMERMMSTGTKEQIARVTSAFMQMKKFDTAVLEHAFKGE